MNELLATILTFAKPVIAYGAFLFVIGIYIPRSKRYLDRIPFVRNRSRARIYRTLAKGVIGFFVAYALIATVVQYTVWNESDFTRILLTVPITDMFDGALGDMLFDNPLGYFLFFSWGRFWLEVVFTFISAALFGLFLRALRRYNDRFFADGEVELGYVLALIVAWPGNVLFVGLTFFTVVFVSLFRMFFLRETYTTLGYPFLLAAIIVLVWQDPLLSLMGLDVLRITALSSS
jgi:hypothetical protein